VAETTEINPGFILMNSISYYILIVFFGLAVGSFLNVVILRFDELKTIWLSRSHCPKCKKELRWRDLIPFFSYIFLWGKCRYCKKPISYQYPVVEGFTGLIFAIIFWQYGFSWEGLILAIIICIMIVIATYDLLHSEIPDTLSYLAIFFSLGLIFYRLGVNGHLNYSNDYINYAQAILIGGGFLGLLVLASREKWMGRGDILLGVLMGLLLSFSNVLTGMFIAFVLGSIVGLILIAAKYKTMKDAVPFGPFLILGTLVAFFWGGDLVNLYFKYLGIY